LFCDAPLLFSRGRNTCDSVTVTVVDDCVYILMSRFPGLFSDASEHTHFELFNFSVFPFFSCSFRAVD